MDSVTPRAAGLRIGPYELLALIGAIGMGEVWKVRDTRLDRIAAIKFSQARFSDRFEREARAIAALSHPNVCQLYAVGPARQEFATNAGDSTRTIAVTQPGTIMGTVAYMSPEQARGLKLDAHSAARRRT